jgi:DNA-directed RNA polymerase beta subunit
MSVEADTFFYMIISCESCAVRDIGCEDCILTFFIAKSETKKESEAIAIEIPDSTAEAIDLLSSRGIIRPLRYNSA